MTIVNQATEEDSKGNYEAAYRLYDNAIEHFLCAIKCKVDTLNGLNSFILDEKGEKLKEQLRKKVDEYLNRAEELKKAIAENKTRKAVPNPAKDGGDSKDNDGDDAETKKMQTALSSAILSEKPNVRWEDIAGLEGAKEALKEAVILPIRFPHLFSGKRTPWKGILLYGVPLYYLRVYFNYNSCISSSYSHLVPVNHSWQRLWRLKPIQHSFQFHLPI